MQCLENIVLHGFDSSKKEDTDSPKINGKFTLIKINQCSLFILQRLFPQICTKTAYLHGNLVAWLFNIERLAFHQKSHLAIERFQDTCL